MKNLSDRSRGIEKIRLRQFFLKEIYYELALKTWFNLTWNTQWMKYGLVLGQGEREYVKENIQAQFIYIEREIDPS